MGRTATFAASGVVVHSGLGWAMKVGGVSRPPHPLRRAPVESGGRMRRREGSRKGKR